MILTFHPSSRWLAVNAGIARWSSACDKMVGHDDGLDQVNTSVRLLWFQTVAYYVSRDGARTMVFWAEALARAPQLGSHFGLAASTTDQHMENTTVQGNKYYCKEMKYNTHLPSIVKHAKKEKRRNCIFQIPEVDVIAIQTSKGLVSRGLRGRSPCSSLEITFGQIVQMKPSSPSSPSSSLT